MQTGTLIAGAVVLLMLGLAGYSVYRSRKKGSSCGGNCAGCGGACHSEAAASVKK